MATEKRLVPSLSRRHPSSGQRNGIDVPAVIGLAAMSGAAITEKQLGIAVGARTEVFDLVYSGAEEPRRDVTGQIEHGVSWPHRRREERLCSRVRGSEALDQVGPDFVMTLADHRP